MNKKQFILFASIAIAISITAALLIGIPASANLSDISYNNTWTDTFDSATLNNRWSWVREDPSYWSLTARPGFMRLTTQPESLWEGWNAQENLLLTTVQPGDFRITTRVNFTPTQSYHQAGLLVYQDDDNYLKLHRTYDYGNYIGFVHEIEGSPDAQGIVETANDVYLQIIKHSDVYSASYSLDNLAWNQVAVFTCTLTNPKVGLAVNHHTLSVSELPADFDFFTVEENLVQVFLPVMIR